MKFHTITFFSLVFLLFSCSTENNETEFQELEFTPPPPMVEETVNDTAIYVNWDELQAGEIEEKTRIKFDAYVGGIVDRLVEFDLPRSYYFYQRPHQKEGYYSFFFVDQGGFTNNVNKLPDNYTDADLVYVTDDRTRARCGDYVQIEGILKSTDSDKFLTIKFEKMTLLVEKPPLNDSVFNTAIELTDEILADTTLDNFYCYVTGKLKLSFVRIKFGDEYSIQLTQNNNTSISTVYIKEGDKPGEMKPIDEDSEEEDFIIRDFYGNEQNGAEGEYKVYGTYSRYENKLDGSFTAEDFIKE